MSRRRGKKQNTTAIIIRSVIAVVIILLAIIIGVKFAKKKTVEVASETILEKIIREQIKEEHRKNAQSSDGDIIVNQSSESNVGKSEKEIIDEEVQKTLAKIDSKDRETIEEIISNHMKMDLIKDAIRYLERGDIDGLKERAKKELSQEEIDKLMNIYDKYEDEF